MGNLPKSALLLLFAVVLSFAGIGEGVCAGVAQTEPEGIAGKNFQQQFSQGEHIKYQLLHSEHVVSPVNSQSAPHPNNRSIGLLNVSYLIEHRLQDIATQYLLHAKDICCSLSGNDIIFPFHYFW